MFFHNKRAIEDHFDSNYELESRLEERGKYELLSVVTGILPKGVSCVYIRQPTPLGLGHAVLCAKDVIGNEPFAVLLADDLIDSENTPCLKSMISVFDEMQSSVIAVQSVAPSEVDRYGIVKTEDRIPNCSRISSIVEKPKPENAPSNLAVVGRYILTPEIFDELETVERGAGNEVQLTDAIAKLLVKQNVYAHQFEGVRYDCGSKLGYLQATVAYGLKHAEVGERFKKTLQELVADITTA